MTQKICELAPTVAVISAGVLATTVDVVTAKVVLDKPEVMFTDAGTVAAEALLVRLTVVVPATAPLIVTVQVDEAGGVTLAGLQFKPETTGPDG